MFPCISHQLKILFFQSLINCQLLFQQLLYTFFHSVVCKNDRCPNTAPLFRTIKSEKVPDITAGAWTAHFCSTLVIFLCLVVRISGIPFTPLMHLFLTILCNSNNGDHRMPHWFRQCCSIFDTMVDECAFATHTLCRADQIILCMELNDFGSTLKFFKIT